jgi:HAD superfamily hydrolase (TIGR01544 family)
MKLRDFHYQDKERLLKKFSLFAQGGSGKLHLVLDFDRTMTEWKNSFGEVATSWGLLRRHLHPDFQGKYQEMFDFYRPREVSGEMTLIEALTWWERTLQLYVESQLKWEDIDSGVCERMPIRPFVKELFEVCERERVPVLIISAGLKNIIELWCQKHTLCPSKVISTQLIFSDNGYLKSWERESLVHPLNKKEKGLEEILKIKIERPNAILIGDSLQDALMVEGEENVLRILINDELGKEKSEDFDLMTKDKTFKAVVDLMKKLLKTGL